MERVRHVLLWTIATSAIGLASHANVQSGLGGHPPGWFENNAGAIIGAILGASVGTIVELVRYVWPLDPPPWSR